MGSALDSKFCSAGNTDRNILQESYTWTLRNSILAVGVCVRSNEENATQAAVQNATVVKKPKTFWTRLMAECIATHGLL